MSDLRFSGNEAAEEEKEMRARMERCDLEDVLEEIGGNRGAMKVKVEALK